MIGVVIRDAGNVSRTATAVVVRDAANVARTVSEIRVRDINNVSRVVYRAGGAAVVTATANTSYVSGYTRYSSSATTNPVTVTGSGGTGPYTYAWSLLDYTSAIPPTATAPTSATSSFFQTGMAAGDVENSTWRCTVTDANGASGSVDITAAFVRVESGGVIP